ncbi:MAG: hypothetical protein IH621_07215 [Krumholzibacteria bacterium]|nr:hypothetical protein [Candidatus Krumholzibacteria bacterium]
MATTFGAVVTGDVNASSRLAADAARGLEALLERCYAETDAALPRAGLRGYSAFRGDAWQFAVGCPEFAVRAALFYRGRLLVHSERQLGRRLHSSAAVGFGTIEWLPDSTSSAGGGTAYELSGRRLDRLRRRMPGLGLAGLADQEEGLDVLLGVMDALARSWTAHRADAVALAMQGLSQGEIARQWEPRVSQQAIHKHLAAAGWPALEPALAWLETTLTGCFAENNLHRL